MPPGRLSEILCACKYNNISRAKKRVLIDNVQRRATPLSTATPRHAIREPTLYGYGARSHERTIHTIRYVRWAGYVSYAQCGINGCVAYRRAVERAAGTR